ncbi:MAG: DUF354 domain-containing protein, partial [Promethearchaeota archaeon]
IRMLQNENAELLITARDYDSTFQILDSNEIQYIKSGEHGGEKLEQKLEAYINRLKILFSYVKTFSPDYFVTFSSVEGTRIAYGLNIPSIGFNDEPRNEPVCKLILPFLNKIITPKCIPKDRYLRLHADEDKLIRYNGIDEIGWLSEYTPNPDILKKFNVERNKFIIMRSEPSFASYFIDGRFMHQSLNPEESILSQILPPIQKDFPNHKYFLIIRTEKQEQFLRIKLKEYNENNNVIITRYLPNMVDLCYFGALIISGGGTIVRESSLLNVPSIETFPGETAPQEHFLIKNGFPLEHIKKPGKIVARSIEILNDHPSDDRFTLSYKKKISQFENPNKICFDHVMNDLKN